MFFLLSAESIIPDIIVAGQKIIVIIISVMMVHHMFLLVDGRYSQVTTVALRFLKRCTAYSVPDPTRMLDGTGYCNQICDRKPTVGLSV